MIGQSKPKKYYFEGYAITLRFKTDKNLQITATDQFTLQTFENKSVQFSKMQKDAIIAALQKKSQKNLQCKLNRLKQNTNCLQLQFIAKFDFIPSFQQKAILYKIKKSQNEVKIPALDRKSYLNFKAQLQQIQNMIPKQKTSIQALDVANTALKIDVKEKQQFCMIIIGANIALFIIFLFLISFSNYFVLVCLLNGGFYFYDLNYPYKIVSFFLKKGIYNIQVSGIYNSLNYNSSGCNLTFELKNQNQTFTRKTKTHNMYSYGYPVNVSMIVKAQKQGQWVLSVKKNTVFSDGQLLNSLIVIEPTTYLVSQK